MYRLWCRDGAGCFCGTSFDKEEGSKCVKLKLDENIYLRVVTLLQLAGHDIATVPGQGLSSAPNTEVIDVCKCEGRCLVTCDLSKTAALRYRGFGNRLKYNPSDYPGIVIIRLPSRPNFAFWQEAIETLIQGLNAAEVTGKLWIIQRGSIQEYRPIEPDV